MTVGIVGLGLIGGSLARAYHDAGWRVLAHNRSASVTEFAQMAGAVDAPLTKDNLSECDLLLLAVYPQAELSRALEDPRFLRLVTHGVDAKSAYELTHLRELTAEAMAYGARRAREELTAAMQAGYLRPRESGLTPGAGGAFAESPEHWPRQTREELKTRARRGETIRL